MVRRAFTYFITGLLACVLVSDAQIFLMSRRNQNGTVPPNNCDSINDANLKAYWKLDEASGNAVDDKGANDLTDVNSVGTGVGVIGASRLFNPATPTYFSIADNADLSTGDIDFTFAAWINFGSVITPGEFRTVVGKWPGGGENEYLLQLDGDISRLVFTVSSDGTAEASITANSIGAPASTTWYHVAAWHDSVANTLNIQVNNGTVDSVSYSTGVRDGTGAFLLGQFGGGGTWNGYIDEAFFTKRVLTAEERYSLYYFTIGCRPSTL